MTTQTPEPEGGFTLPNENVAIPNYAILDVKRVVVYGTRGRGPDGKSKYRPSVALFLSDEDEPLVLLRVNLHETFDDAEVMARMGVIWANNMFSRVSKIVKIFDEDETLLVALNVSELIEIEDAVEAMRIINVTNKYLVH